MEKKINKKEPLFYVATTFYSFLDGKHKSAVRNIIKNMNCQYLEFPNGEKIVFALCKEKDIDGKKDIPCQCGCEKAIGFMETLTEKEMEQKYPKVYHLSKMVCWKCSDNQNIVAKKTFWDKGKDEIITFWCCRTCAENTPFDKVDEEINKEGKKRGFTFEPVSCNQCKKGVWTDWKSRERVEMYKCKELFYVCSNCIVKDGDEEIGKVMAMTNGQGGWITFNEATTIKYNQIQQQEYKELTITK